MAETVAHRRKVLWASIGWLLAMLLVTAGFSAHAADGSTPRPVVDRDGMLIMVDDKTTRAGLLTSPLRDRFGIVSRLDFYSVEELCRILARSARLLGVAGTDEGLAEIARRSRGTPRIANRLLKRVRDYAQVKGDGRISREMADAALTMLEVDQLGLDRMDRQILLTILEKYDGGPVGLGTLATAASQPTTPAPAPAPAVLDPPAADHSRPRCRAPARRPPPPRGSPSPPARRPRCWPGTRLSRRRTSSSTTTSS